MKNKEETSNDFAKIIVKDINKNIIKMLEIIIEHSKPEYIDKVDIIDFIETYIISLKKER